jgi:phosphocarrier protein
MTDQSVIAEVVISNKKGLHARASAAFVKCADQFDAQIDVTKDGQTVGGSSIMGLMMLAASQGSSIVIEAKGPQGDDAVKALIDLIEAKFHEGE